MDNNISFINEDRDKQFNIIKKFVGNSRMNQYVILFDMLNAPLERFGTNDYVGKLSDDSKYVMQSFRSLKKKGLIEDMGKFGKEIMFQVPVSSYDNVRKFLFERFTHYLINKKKREVVDFCVEDILVCFGFVFSVSPSDLLSKRLELVEKQLLEFPNDASLLNVKNKLLGSVDDV